LELTMKKNRRPMQRPADLADRMEDQRMSDRMDMLARQDPGMTGAEMERDFVYAFDASSSAPGRSPRPMMRPAKKFAEGGEVRGCKGVQMSGKGFSGSY
jgi:hypothetical protein